MYFLRVESAYNWEHVNFIRIVSKFLGKREEGRDLGIKKLYEI